MHQYRPSGGPDDNLEGCLFLIKAAAVIIAVIAAVVFALYALIELGDK